jgi:ferritin
MRPTRRAISAPCSSLDWFVKEQGEEEKNAEGLIKKFELFGDDAKSLYMLDRTEDPRLCMAPSLVL